MGQPAKRFVPLAWIVRLSRREIFDALCLVFSCAVLADFLRNVSDARFGRFALYIGISSALYYGALASAVFWAFRASGRVPGPGGAVDVP